MNTSAIVTVLFLVGIFVLTGVYLAINAETMQEDYMVILAIASIANILLLLCFTFEIYRYWLVIAIIMILEGLTKALFERVLPEKEVDDFIFVIWRFNDQWTYWLKAMWHISIDLCILAIVVMLKNSYRVFSKEK